MVQLTLIGAFQEHFDLAHAGMPDGIFPPVREKPYFSGLLQMAGLERPVNLRVRGNSSLQECPFPKLKLKISRAEREGTPFFDAREIKIGAHCAEGGRGSIGRLREQTATYREALAYETMALLGILSPRVRRATIEYRDTTPPAEFSETGWQIRRDAFLLEDVEVLAERLGGRALADSEVAALANADFDELLIAKLRLFHVLLGNWDFALSEDGVGLWNTDVIQIPGGKLIPVAGDFDLASWVTEEVRPTAPWDYRPDLPGIDRRAHYEIELIQQRSSAAGFNAAREHFLSFRPAIEAQIHSAQVDEPGRANALRHLQAFFEALTSLSE